jgi:hypothetical protein
MRAIGQQKIAAVIGRSSLFPVLQEASSRRPMMSMEAAKGALDRDEDGVVALIGTWLVGWDIATPGSVRREWRILTRSVSLAARFLETKQRPPHWIWNEVLGLILLRLLTDQPAITGVNIQHSLNCSSTHVMHLIECAALELLPGTTYGKGRGRSPLIARGSFADFLRAHLEDSRNIIGLPSEAVLCSKEIPGIPPVGILLSNEGIQTNKPTIP